MEYHLVDATNDPPVQARGPLPPLPRQQQQQQQQHFNPAASSNRGWNGARPKNNHNNNSANNVRLGNHTSTPMAVTAASNLDDLEAGGDYSRPLLDPGGTGGGGGSAAAAVSGSYVKYNSFANFWKRG